MANEGRINMPTEERKVKWVIVTDPLEDHYAQSLLEAAKSKGFRIRLTNTHWKHTDLTIELSDVSGCILCFHGPWEISQLVSDFIQSLRKKNGVVVVATRASRFENLKPWSSDIGTGFYWPTIRSAPDGSLDDYFSIEDVLMIMSQVSFS
jgi:hypothetical protein